MAEATSADINVGKHVKYFVANLTMLPTAYTETETNRMTLAFFCLASLELLGALETAVSERNRKDWIEWIYAQQIKPAPDGSDLNRAKCGFRGASWSGRPFDSHATTSDYIPYDSGHMTNTYTALISLLILGDDLARVDRDAIVESMRCMQQPDGSLGPTEESLERDARFFFSACAVSYILNDWRGLDLDQCVHYARQLQTYEGTFGQQPHMEAHGGSTFCGVAALTLMGKQDQGIVNKDKLIRWCLSRQTTGFAGRPNKDADACYCFWIGAALTMMDAFQWANKDNLRAFLAQCQTDFGGFGKAPGARPDLMHSYMGVAALSLMGEPGIGRLDVAVNAPATAMARLKKQCAFWS